MTILTNKIRLLHLIKSLDMGGIEKSTILYSNHLQEKIDFIGIYASKGFFDDSDFIDNNVKRFFPQHPVQQKKYFIHSLMNILSILKENKISHIHYHHRIFIPYIFFVRLFLPKIKIIYTHHSVFNDSINKIIISDKIIALNETTKLDLPQHLQNKSSIIPHGVKVNLKAFEKSTSPRNIGYIGRFAEFKGIINLIESFKNITLVFKDSKLILVGNGPLKKEILKIVKKEKLEQKVEIREPIISEDAIYEDIDILVLPSEKLEGFGLAVIEAMARQIIVVVRDLPIFEGFIKNNYNGVIFTDDLDKIIITILTNPSLYTKIKQNGYQTVKQNYSFEETMQNYLKFYKDN